LEGKYWGEILMRTLGGKWNFGTSPAFALDQKKKSMENLGASCQVRMKIDFWKTDRHFHTTVEYYFKFSFCVSAPPLRLHYRYQTVGAVGVKNGSSF
jgi:hypothetical protein